MNPVGALSRIDMLIRKLASGYLVVVLLLLAVFQLPAFVGSGLSNLTGITLLHVPSCNPEWFVCQNTARPYPPILWAGNRQALLELRTQLETERSLSPQSDGLRLHLAEVEFALGYRDRAAELLPPVLPAARYGPLDSEWRGLHSLLLTPGRYESSLVAAYQQLALKQWDNAVAAFRLALQQAPEHLLPSDLQDYQVALAQQYAANAALSESNARSAYLAGKYFLAAGNTAQAKYWLSQAQASSGWSALLPEDRAQALLQAGMVFEQESQLQMARATYESSLLQSPEHLEAKLRLISVLRNLGASSAADSLQAMLQSQGPTYQLGQFGENYLARRSATLGDGWVLGGYDVDADTLEAGGLVEIWLWWQRPGKGTPANQEWLELGEWRLQHQIIPNLVANSGFEWGIDRNGYPLGYELEAYGAPVGSVQVLDTDGPSGNRSHVLRLVNDRSRSVGVVSFKVPVEREAVYLLAGWKRETAARQGMIGISCDTGGAPYINQPVPTQSLGKWIHFSAIVTPSPAPKRCGVFLPSFGTSGSTEWDQIVFVRLSTPPQDSK